MDSRHYDKWNSNPRSQSYAKPWNKPNDDYQRRKHVGYSKHRDNFMPYKGRNAHSFNRDNEYSQYGGKYDYSRSHSTYNTVPPDKPHAKQESPWSEEAQEKARKKDISDAANKLKNSLDSWKAEKNNSSDATLTADSSNLSDNSEPKERSIRIGRTSSETSGHEMESPTEKDTHKDTQNRRTAYPPKTRSYEPRAAADSSVKRPDASPSKESKRGKETQRNIQRNLIGELMSLPKENLKELLNNPKVHPKIGQGMNTLVKENRLILAQNLRSLAESKITSREFGESELVNEMESILDTTLVVDLCKLPPEMINQMSAIFQMDFEIPCTGSERIHSLPSDSSGDENFLTGLRNSSKVFPDLGDSPEVMSKDTKSFVLSSSVAIDKDTQKPKYQAYLKKPEEVLELETPFEMIAEERVSIVQNSKNSFPEPNEKKNEKVSDYECSTEEDEAKSQPEPPAEKPKPLSLQERLKVMEEMKSARKRKEGETEEGDMGSKNKNSNSSNGIIGSRQWKEKIRLRAEKKKKQADEKPEPAVEARNEPINDDESEFLLESALEKSKIAQVELTVEPFKDAKEEETREEDRKSPYLSETCNDLEKQIEQVSLLYQTIQANIDINTNDKLEVADESKSKVAESQSLSKETPLELLEKSLLECLKDESQSESLSAMLRRHLNLKLFRNECVSNGTQTQAKEFEDNSSQTERPPEIVFKSSGTQTETAAKVIRKHAETQTQVMGTEGETIYGASVPVPSPEESSDSLLAELRKIDQAVYRLNERKSIIFVKLTTQNGSTNASTSRDISTTLLQTITQGDPLVWRHLMKEDTGSADTDKKSKDGHKPSISHSASKREAKEAKTSKHISRKEDWKRRQEKAGRSTERPKETKAVKALSELKKPLEETSLSRDEHYVKNWVESQDPTSYVNDVDNLSKPSTARSDKSECVRKPEKGAKTESHRKEKSTGKQRSGQATKRKVDEPKKGAKKVKLEPIIKSDEDKSRPAEAGVRAVIRAEELPKSNVKSVNSKNSQISKNINNSKISKDSKGDQSNVKRVNNSGDVSKSSNRPKKSVKLNETKEKIVNKSKVKLIENRKSVKDEGEVSLSGEQARQLTQLTELAELKESKQVPKLDVSKGEAPWARDTDCDTVYDSDVEQDCRTQKRIQTETQELPKPGIPSGSESEKDSTEPKKARVDMSGSEQDVKSKISSDDEVSKVKSLIKDEPTRKTKNSGTGSVAKSFKSFRSQGSEVLREESEKTGATCLKSKVRTKAEKKETKMSCPWDQPNLDENRDNRESDTGHLLESVKKLKEEVAMRMNISDNSDSDVQSKKTSESAKVATVKLKKSGKVKRLLLAVTDSSESDDCSAEAEKETKGVQPAQEAQVQGVQGVPQVQQIPQVLQVQVEGSKDKKDTKLPPVKKCFVLVKRLALNSIAPSGRSALVAEAKASTVCDFQVDSKSCKSPQEDNCEALHTDNKTEAEEIELSKEEGGAVLTKQLEDPVRDELKMVTDVEDNLKDPPLEETVHQVLEDSNRRCASPSMQVRFAENTEEDDEDDEDDEAEDTADTADTADGGSADLEKSTNSIDVASIESFAAGADAVGEAGCSTGKKKKTFVPFSCASHTGTVMDIKVVGKYILAACEDGSVYCYSAKNGRRKREYSGHTEGVTCISVYLDKEDTSSGTLYTGSHDHRVRSFLIKTSALQKESKPLGSSVQCLEQNWGTVFAGLQSGSVARLSSKKLRKKDSPLEISDAAILALKTMMEGPRRIIIVATRNNTVTIRDATTGLLLRNVSENFSGTVYSLTVDSNTVYCGSDSSFLLSFDFTEGRCVGQYECGHGVLSIKLIKNFIFASSYDGNIYVFNSKTKERVGVIKGPGKMLMAMEIYKNKQLIASSKDGKLESWLIPVNIRNMIKESLKS